jgi:hypothetical protein
VQGLKPVLHVATVGAQLSSMADISDAMCTAAGVTPSGKRMAVSAHRPHADALLLVSGSHPVRTLPLLQQFLPGSVAMLRQASQLKQRGVLPQQLALWAVANPVMEPDASYTEQKVSRPGRPCPRLQLMRSMVTVLGGQLLLRAHCHTTGSPCQLPQLSVMLSHPGVAAVDRCWC